MSFPGSTNFVVRRLRVLGAVAVMACSVGCGGSGDKGAVPVSGRVTLNGKPAAKAIVTFHPAAPAEKGVNVTRPVGNADENGQFKLTTQETNDGAPPGEYKVTVNVNKVTLPPNGAEPIVTDLVPEQFRNPDTTPLRATVKAGSSEPVVLEIGTP